MIGDSNLLSLCRADHLSWFDGCQWAGRKKGKRHRRGAGAAPRQAARRPHPGRRRPVTGASPALYESSLSSLALIRRGKVRDIYALDDRRLLIVASDRLSAFDVVLPSPIPGKGRILTQLANFWFARMGGIVANHLLEVAPESVVASAADRAQVGGRAVVVRRLQPLPVEAIVRGYLAGSGWKDYQATGAVSGMALPKGLPQAGRLPEPIFTPSTKAATGAHDENIAFAQMATLVGHETAAAVRRIALRLYAEAAAYAEGRGIIIADTKFEFALDAAGTLVLIDEILTPDSSRFWPVEGYRTGISPPSFDKQFVRDYLEGTGWNKRPPAPALPEAVVAGTAARYQDAFRRLVGREPEL
ncbi:MAG: phosphoribosylaminoimidazolesuccinocarboxamide synthase [Alphaproteobacteria bacterium]|nr:phosphoribosylaminoimidazolesuccinocarboxamide synthase [Alphaproteobacteria bacterium]